MLLLGGMIWWILVGLIAGWLAARVMKTSGGLLLDMLIGMAGAILGGWLFNTFPLGHLLGSILTAFVGSVLLLWLVRLVKKA